MARIAARWHFCIVLLTAAFVASCSDVGDNSPFNPASPNGGQARDASLQDSSAVPGAADSAVDHTTPLADGSDGGSADDATPDRVTLEVGTASSGSVDDATTTPGTGTGTSSSGIPATAVPDAGTTSTSDAAAGGIPDSTTTTSPDTGTAGPPDTGAHDTRTHDTGVPDTGTSGTPDSSSTGLPDAGMTETLETGAGETGASPEAGAADSGNSEAGELDARAPDAGTPDDSHTADTGAPDAPAPDAGPSPCAMFNNPSGASARGCTPTEQRFVDKSVDCYTCLVMGSCLDDVTFGDMNKECEDLSGTATGGAKAGTADSALCLATIDCILSTKCASASPADCYCGTLVGSACANASIPGDGACAQPEADGSNHLVTEAASIVSPDLASITRPSGKADALFACANLNGCQALCSQ